jgi:hypothetical protein
MNSRGPNGLGSVAYSATDASAVTAATPKIQGWNTWILSDFSGATNSAEPRRSQATCMYAANAAIAEIVSREGDAGGSDSATAVASAAPTSMMVIADHDRAQCSRNGRR